MLDVIRTRHGSHGQTKRLKKSLSKMRMNSETTTVYRLFQIFVDMLVL